ncbi:hypothetical protein [Micromonospora sp. NPDC003816]|uniref:hypothetical protein n=1 Tax=Micromonospora sp. NPDC003816 TaxID=3364224 RepID=UPI0036CA9136
MTTRIFSSSRSLLGWFRVVVAVVDTSTGPVIPPVVLSDPGSAAERSTSGGLRRGPLPMSSLPERCTSPRVYGVAALEGSGRLRDRFVVGALGWRPGTRLDIRERAGIVVVRGDDQGVFRLTGQGHVRLPAAVRHWCALRSGDRLLLVADPAVGLLLVCPMATLDEIVTQAHAAVLAGGVS